MQAIARWKHLSALTHEEQETVLSRSVIERARRQIGLFTSLLLIVSTVIIGLIIYTMTLDKKKAIATLKLIGAPDSRIVGLIIQRSLGDGIDQLLLGLGIIHSIYGYFLRRLVLEMPDATILFGGVFLWYASLQSALTWACVSRFQNRSGNGPHGITLMQASPVVEIKNISKHFGEGSTRVDALREVTLDVYPVPWDGLRGPGGFRRESCLTSSGAF